MSRRVVNLNEGRGRNYSGGIRNLNYYLVSLMDEFTKSFGLAMMGNEPNMERAVNLSLDHWYTTDNVDIVMMALKLLKVSHTNREDLVLNIFDAIFGKTGCFFILFQDVVFGDCQFPSKELLDEVEWYLIVGSKRTYMFQNEVVPMIDMPKSGCTLAAHAAFRAHTSVLLLFLRYGADPDKAVSCLRPTLTPNWEAVLRLILRAMPYPTPNVLKIVPSLVLVPKLKHLCKMVVRKVLVNELPKGIYDLNIPFELKEYLDFLRDV